MPPREFDLEFGDPARASPDEETKTRRRSSTRSSTARAEAEESKIETEIRSRLDRMWQRLVKGRRAKEDDELADAIEEDADAMTEGFMSVTTALPGLRGPVIMGLNILEPVLAFKRVVGILVVRFFYWRQSRNEPDVEYQNENGVPVEQRYE